MDETKNWIIRTRGKQILGPVSRKKLLELMDSKMLHPDDELCSGNGYWFFVKEKSLFEKYISQGNKQDFSILSVYPKNENEASPARESTRVINLNANQESNSKMGNIPNQTDLEYPDMSNFSKSSASPKSNSEVSVGHAGEATASSSKTNENTKKTEESGANPDAKFPQQNDLSYPDLPVKK